MTDGYQKLLENTARYRKTKKGVLTNTYQHQKSRRKVFYTLKELHDKFLDDKQFDRIYKEWVKRGYDKQFKPSIDRIDCLKDYTLKNIHILTWAENRYKQRFEFKRIRARKVLQIMGNATINVFNSVSHAVKYTGLGQGNISSCLHGKRNYCGGYKWQYFDIHENPELLTDNN